jgi:hypothetical protein
MQMKTNGLKNLIRKDDGRKTRFIISYLNANIFQFFKRHNRFKIALYWIFLNPSFNNFPSFPSFFKPGSSCRPQLTRVKNLVETFEDRKSETDPERVRPLCFSYS